MEIIAGTVTICALYPLKLGPELRHYGPTRGVSGNTWYAMEPAPRDGYSTLTVIDCWQQDRNATFVLNQH